MTRLSLRQRGERTLQELPGKRRIRDGFEHGWRASMPEISGGIRVLKMETPPMGQETVIERDPTCTRMRRSLPM